MNKVVVAALAALASTPALASTTPLTGGGGSVPEIDALAGVAAIAVVGAAVALIRERSK